MNHDPTSVGSLVAIGHVVSSLNDRSRAPKQGSEGAPQAWIEIEPAYAAALSGILVGDRLLVITWLHLADREVLQVHPRSNPKNPLTGVFATRSPARPNPLGLHPVSVLEVSGTRLCVDALEAVDGTPVVDLKPVLGPDEG